MLLEVNGLKKYFPITAGILRRTVGYVKAVDGVSFFVREGTTFGIVGESGCGKSTLGKMVMRIIDPTEGGILFDDTDLLSLSGAALREKRSLFQMIFQDPNASLNPKMKVAEIVGEPFIVARKTSKPETRERVSRLLETVGLSADSQNKYPHEFSGGQKQRIGIARALALNPKLIVADEAVSALDVSVQSQILNLLVELKKRFHLAYIFISHNLAVVRHIADEVGVMYLGHLVEAAENDQLFSNPLHPYTRALLASAPVPRRGIQKKRIFLEGEVPSPSNPPSGCPFHPRCSEAMQICSLEKPPQKFFDGRHQVACHLYA
jgi:peptide/nickel transport system ATP-binding protein/oligopeptide transport system ATP-binding protein